MAIVRERNLRRRANDIGTHSKSAGKKAVQSEGEAEGGCGGNSASPEPKRSPAALLVQGRGQQKSFLFLLEEKNRRAQIKKCEENFFAGQRAKRAAAGRSVQNSAFGFLSKNVRTSSKKHRIINNKYEEYEKSFYHSRMGW